MTSILWEPSSNAIAAAEASRELANYSKIIPLDVGSIHD